MTPSILRRHPRPVTSWPGVWMLLALFALPAAPVLAQGGGDAATLDAVETALDDGRFEAARAGVERWWEAGEAGRDRRQLQRALWLRARLTVEPQAAELLYRRLVVEFPGGAHSDEALYRLAQGAQARGDTEAATRYLEILVRDYPASPLRVTARAELARGEAATPGAREAGAPRGEPATPPAATPPASPTRVDPPPPAARPDPEPATAPRAEAPSPPVSGPYTLQYGAFSTLERARGLAAELEMAGLDVRVVQVEGSPLFRVRGEAFASRAEAGARAEELRSRGFELLVSDDRERESRVGG
jgi:hypothetical protein